MLPCSTASGEGASFIEALFTSTSAVCVTGLVVEDTATYWSVFGQSIIMFLIQVGGMGVVTVAVAVTLFSGRKIGLMQRSTMQEAVSAHHVGGIVRLTKFILKTTVCIELAGAVLLLPAFIRDYGTVKGVWYAVFHSISAFCNAGFDLFGVREPFSSLTAYADQPLVNLTIMALIITGGIGFLTWEDISKNHLNFRKYHMQTKVIVTTTGILILLPALYLFFFEYQGLPMGERVLSSLLMKLLDTAINRLRKEDDMSYNVSIKTIPERYAATVHMTIPHYEDEGMVWQILREETAHLNMADAEPCLVAASFLDDEFMEENVELISWKTVKGQYPDTEHVKFQTLPAIKVASCTIKGSYDQMNDCYAAIIGWVNENGFKCSGPMFNIYQIPS